MLFVGASVHLSARKVYRLRQERSYGRSTGGSENIPDGVFLVLPNRVFDEDVWLNPLRCRADIINRDKRDLVFSADDILRVFFS